LKRTVTLRSKRIYYKKKRELKNEKLSIKQV